MHTGLDSENGTWLNPPPKWELADGVLNAQTAANSDFWRKTHYGFIHDNGHAFLFDAPQDFTATVSFNGDYQHNYDHAGLLLRSDAENWIKFGIEFVSGVPSFAVVATFGVSDWSVCHVKGLAGPQTIRISRAKDAVIVHYLNGGKWVLLRVAKFPVGKPAKIGPFLCSPERSGLDVCFRDFSVEAVVVDPLYG